MSFPTGITGTNHKSETTSRRKGRVKKTRLSNPVRRTRNRQTNAQSNKKGPFKRGGRFAKKEDCLSGGLLETTDAHRNHGHPTE